ncbi:MAG: hypothetical protein IT338_14180 [Thermomicrobiales bacterium]|nr:hypothetical protein [Thermomicrobiales bacterium]
MGCRKWAGVVASFLALVVATFAAADGLALSVTRQGAGIVEVGSGPEGERSLALDGRSTRSGQTIELYGYATAVVGLDPSLLSTGTALSVDTARFTFQGEIEISDSSRQGDVETTRGSGTLRLYYADAGGAAWDSPASFAAGEPIASWSLQAAEVMQRQAPGVGVVVGDGQMMQTDAEEFAVGGDTYRLGKAAIGQRLRYVGALLDGAGAVGAAIWTGTVTVTENAVQPVRLGEAATPLAAPPASVEVACAALEPWASRSREALTQAATLAATAQAGSPDVETIDRAARDAQALVDAQRALAVPAGAAEANRLAITALSTTARGLQAVASASAAGDAGLLSQGQGVLADGTSLIGRASDAIDAQVAVCPAG